VIANLVAAVFRSLFSFLLRFPRLCRLLHAFSGFSIRALPYGFQCCLSEARLRFDPSPVKHHSCFPLPKSLGGCSPRCEGSVRTTSLLFEQLRPALGKQSRPFPLPAPFPLTPFAYLSVIAGSFLPLVWASPTLSSPPLGFNWGPGSRSSLLFFFHVERAFCPPSTPPFYRFFRFSIQISRCSRLYCLLIRFLFLYRDHRLLMLRI